MRYLLIILIFPLCISSCTNTDKNNCKLNGHWHSVTDNNIDQYLTLDIKDSIFEFIKHDLLARDYFSGSIKYSRENKKIVFQNFMYTEYQATLKNDTLI